MSADTAAQNPAVLKQFWDQTYEGEQQVQIHLKNYRLVTRIETFDDRINAAIKYPVETDPKGSIATLHDIQTGEPLEACKTPCELSIEAARTYMVGFFRLGHRPSFRPAHSEDLVHDPISHHLGLNYLDAYDEGYQCYKDFVARKNKPDSDAEPCYRVPSMMPPEAQNSGHCLVAFDVNSKGRAENIKAKSCTDEIFRNESEQVVSWWAYHPKVERGQPVTQQGVETKISYRLLGMDGKLLPEL